MFWRQHTHMWSGCRDFNPGPSPWHGRVFRPFRSGWSAEVRVCHSVSTLHCVRLGVEGSTIPIGPLTERWSISCVAVLASVWFGDPSGRPSTSPIVCSRSGSSGKRQMALHLVAVSTTLSLLEDVAGFGEIGDDGVRVSLGDAEVGRDVAEANFRIVGDAEQRSAVVGEEAPVGHGANVPEITRNRLLVFRN